MTGYKIISIDKLRESLGEDETQLILSSYSCPLNSDIEDFLWHKASAFSIQGIAKTHLVFAGFQGSPVLVGYFTLANKTLFIPDKARLGSKLKSRLRRFSTRLDETKMTIMSAPLIAQLGKNYRNNYNLLITGDELLRMACEKIQEIQLAVGGKVAYLECDDHPKLIQFYHDNGFREFDKRVTESKNCLVQMIRYF